MWHFPHSGGERSHASEQDSLAWNAIILNVTCVTRENMIQNDKHDPAEFVTALKFITSLPLKKSRSSIGADIASGVIRPLVYPPPPQFCLSPRSKVPLLKYHPPHRCVHLLICHPLPWMSFLLWLVNPSQYWHSDGGSLSGQISSVLGVH